MASPTSIFQKGQIITSTSQQKTGLSPSSIETEDSKIGYFSELESPNTNRLLDEFDIKTEERLPVLFPGVLLEDVDLKQDTLNIDDLFQCDASNAPSTSTQPVTIKKEPLDLHSSPKDNLNSETNTLTLSETIKTEPWPDISVEGQAFTMDQLLESSTDGFQCSQPRRVKFTYKNAIIQCLQDESKLTLQALYQKLLKLFPQLKLMNNWDNSIRHNLSIHKEIFTHIKGYVALKG